MEFILSNKWSTFLDTEEIERGINMQARTLIGFYEILTIKNKRGHEYEYDGILELTD